MLKRITDLITVEHNKAMKTVKKLSIENSFGQLEKIATCITVGNGTINREIETYLLTKKGIIQMKDKLNYNNNQESELGILEYLKYIPKLLEKIEALEKEIASIKDAVVPELDLTRASGVIKYLNISKSTLDRKIREGELKKGIHFIQNGIGENRRYIPTAIQEYKKNKNKFKVKE